MLYLYGRDPIRFEIFALNFRAGELLSENQNRPWLAGTASGFKLKVSLTAVELGFKRFSRSDASFSKRALCS